MTTFLIGVDEAGYGPNLGPLVVAATLWQVDEPLDEEVSAPNGRPHSRSAGRRLDLYRLLRDRISPSANANRVAIADSKLLYSPAAGLTLLEEGVLAALRSCDLQTASWVRLVDVLGADPDGHGGSLPWHQGWDAVLPVVACPRRVERLAECFSPIPPKPRRSLMSRYCVTLRDVQAVLVQPAHFNHLTAQSGTKATALSRITLQLLDRMLRRLRHSHARDQPLTVRAVCDKHGGRNHYAALLAEIMSQTLIQVHTESRAVSRYRVQLESLDAEIAFQREGEEFLPTALASMTAKYVRELSMRAFNEFWCMHVPDLRPTAGYPSDSHRFKRAISAAQTNLGIADHLLWRSR